MREDGFTLLELLVVITLLAFLSVALLVGMRSTTDIWRKSRDKNVDLGAWANEDFRVPDENIPTENDGENE